MNGEDQLFGFTHIDHCLDSIRQSLMCHSDISPIVWQWTEPQHSVKIHGGIVHTCRNFEKIHQWAREHALQEAIDMSLFVDDDLADYIKPL